MASAFGFGAASWAHVRHVAHNINAAIFTFIPLPRPVPEASAEFVSTRVHARCNQPILAACGPRLRSHRLQLQLPPGQETKEHSHPSTPVAPAPRFPAVNPLLASLDESAPAVPTLPPGGSRSPPLLNSVPAAAAPIQIARRQFESPHRSHDPAPYATFARGDRSLSSMSIADRRACSPTPESNSPKYLRESRRCCIECSAHHAP